MKTAAIIKPHGNVQHLLAAFAALQSVQDRNLKMDTDFGKPFEVTDSGRCNTQCNAAGWVAQHPHFKKMGMKFEESTLIGKGKYIPFIKTNGKAPPAFGYNALAQVLEMDVGSVLRVFSPAYYNRPPEPTVNDVLRRLRIEITRAGGSDSLRAYLKAQKGPSKGKKGKKTAKKTVKKQVKKVKKQVKKAK